MGLAGEVRFEVYVRNEVRSSKAKSGRLSGGIGSSSTQPDVGEDAVQTGTSMFFAAWVCSSLLELSQGMHLRSQHNF